MNNAIAGTSEKYYCADIVLTGATDRTCMFNVLARHHLQGAMPLVPQLRLTPQLSVRKRGRQQYA